MYYVVTYFLALAVKFEYLKQTGGMYYLNKAKYKHAIHANDLRRRALVIWSRLEEKFSKPEPEIVVLEPTEVLTPSDALRERIKFAMGTIRH